MRKEVVFKLGQMESFGTGTLTGLIMNVPPDVPMNSLTEVHIIFEETSRYWKDQDPKGPHLSLAPEHFPWTFLDNILNLQAKGIKVTFERRIADPEE